MLIDLHCPVEYLGHEFTRDDRGNLRAYLKLNNLSQQVVERLDAVAVFEDGAGRRAETPFSMEGLSVPPRSAFSAMVSTDELPGATRLNVTFTRVILEGNGPVWMYNPTRLAEVPDLPSPDGRELNRLLAAAGSDAVVFPYQTLKLWVCVCGRANPYRRRACRRCGRGRDRVLNDFDMARLMARRAPSVPAAKIDMPLFEDGARAPEGDAYTRRRFLRERSMLIRRTITMLVIALLMALGALLWRAATTRPESIPPVKIDRKEIEPPSPFHA
ncbi:hypothetical protein ACH6CV_11470 [Bacillota bacterium Meth-B3]